jgi:hypothetical protein
MLGQSIKFDNPAHAERLIMISVKVITAVLEIFLWMFIDLIFSSRIPGQCI